eukprot:6456857-Amphidinium_carterae.1
MLLHRKVLRFEKCASALDGANTDHLIKKLVEFKVKCTDAVRKVKVRLAERTTQNVQAALKSLAAIAKGAPQGKSWQEGFVGTTWLELKKHADDSIAKMDGNELVDKQSKMAQARNIHPPKMEANIVPKGQNIQMLTTLKCHHAIQRYEDFYGCFELQPDLEAIKGAKEVLQESLVTKCTACCFYHLSSQKEKEVLRTQLKNEVSALRSRGGKETELHPILKQTVQLALALRF